MPPRFPGGERIILVARKADVSSAPEPSGDFMAAMGPCLGSNPSYLSGPLSLHLYVYVFGTLILITGRRFCAGGFGEFMKTVTIYTDGACSGNPGPGGWGAILIYGEHKKELSGGEAQTTNNRMELTGVIAALEALKEPCAVELYSDSKYVIDGLGKGWAKGWRARGWVKSDKKPALNPDLWGRLLDLCEKHTVNLHWVKGHAENQFNNRCDQLAVAESQKYK